MTGWDRGLLGTEQGAVLSAGLCGSLEREKMQGGSKKEVGPDLRGMSGVGGSFCFMVRPLGPLKDAEQESRGIDLPTWLVAQGAEWRRHICGERRGRGTHGGL